MSRAVSLEGKRAVVTGGGRDFGRAVSIWLAREGVEVHICARNLQDAEKTASVIRAEGNRAQSYRCDLTDPANIRTFAAQITDPVDILILSAAQWLEGNLGDAEAGLEIVSTLSSGLTGSVLLADALLPAIREAEEGTIMTMISSCGRPGYTGSIAHPAFYAAKAGLAGFTSILSHRLASEGIRCCGLYPPDFETRDPVDPPQTPPSALLQAETIWRGMRSVLLTKGPCADTISFSGPTREELGL